MMPGFSVPDLSMEDYRRIERDLGLPETRQIGYVVDDIEAASGTLGPLLGVSAWYRPRIVKQKLLYGEKPIDQGLKIAVGYAGAIQVELVERDPERNSLFEAIPAARENEPHHIGFFVRSVDAHRARLAGLGLRPVQYGSIWFARRHRTRVAYFDARSTLGRVVELIEHRAQGCYIGMPRWYVMLGAVTGHVERL